MEDMITPVIYTVTLNYQNQIRYNITLDGIPRVIDSPCFSFNSETVLTKEELSERLKGTEGIAEISNNYRPRMHPHLTLEMLDKFIKELELPKPKMSCMMGKQSFIEIEKKVMEELQLNQDHIDTRVRFLEDTMEDKMYIVEF